MSFFSSLKSKLGAALVAVLGILAVLFKFERDKRKKAEAKLENAEYKKEDAVLEESIRNVRAATEAAVQAAEEEKGRKLTPEEMEQFLKGL